MKKHDDCLLEEDSRLECLDSRTTDWWEKMKQEGIEVSEVD